MVLLCKVVERQWEADSKVIQVSRLEADFVVYLVEQDYEAQMKIMFVNSAIEADSKVYVTSDRLDLYATGTVSGHYSYKPPGPVAKAVSAAGYAIGGFFITAVLTWAVISAYFYFGLHRPNHDDDPTFGLAVIVSYIVVAIPVGVLSGIHGYRSK